MFCNHNIWKCNIERSSENLILLIKGKVIQKPLRLVGMDGIKASQLSYLNFVSTKFSQLKEAENSEVTNQL